MKSSSQLFPVELVSAEHRGSHYEDLYFLKHNRSDDKSVEVAVLHLHAARDNADSTAFLFVHDAFECHWQWMDNGANQDAIDRLVELGYSVWLMDWRGHGSSKLNRQPKENHLQEMAETDLQAVLDFMAEQTQAGIGVVAAGYGAQMVQRLMPQLNDVYRYVFVDAMSLLPSRRYWWPMLRWFSRLRYFGRIWISGEGPEQEPANLFIRLLREAGWFSGYRRRVLRAQVKGVRERAHRILWLCSGRAVERRVNRLTGKQGRVIPVSAESPLEQLDSLISS